MEQLSPTGPIYQAGTLSGNPLSVAAGLAQLRELSHKSGEIYPLLETRTERLTTGLAEVFTKRGIPHQLPRVGSMFAAFVFVGVFSHQGTKISKLKSLTSLKIHPKHHKIIIK